MQLQSLFENFDKLQTIYGDSNLTSVYGAGQTDQPNICLIFMNPTAKNISSVRTWQGIKAPWLGTKKVWRLLFQLGLFNNFEMLKQVERMTPSDWTTEFSEKLYQEIAKESLYITNIAKCTQIDARALPNFVFREYLPPMFEELATIKPKLIFAMGNQVNSILLSKPISVSKYTTNEYEPLHIGEDFSVNVYPTYYPVGQGMRNMPKAIERINCICKIFKLTNGTCQ